MNDTPALRALADSGVPHDVLDVGRSSSLEEHAGKLGVPPGDVVKTLVVRRGHDDYVFVLVPGERRIDWPKLRSHLGVNRAAMPSREEAQAVTGYAVGSITPFGASTAWPVVADAAVAGKPRLAMGSGAHGMSVLLSGPDLVRHLGAEVADVTEPEA